jgi:hypothetical protein
VGLTEWAGSYSVDSLSLQLYNIRLAAWSFIRSGWDLRDSLGSIVENIVRRLQ